MPNKFMPCDKVFGYVRLTSGHNGDLLLVSEYKVSKLLVSEYKVKLNLSCTICSYLFLDTCVENVVPSL